MAPPSRAGRTPKVARSARSSTGTSPAEPELIARAQAGDHDAFARLIALHADFVHAAVRRCHVSPSEIDDVTQEVFLRAWRGLARYDGRAQLSTWLSRIAVNEAHRRLARRRPIPIDRELMEALVSAGPDPPEASPAAQVLDLEFELHLVIALRALPPASCAAVVLRDLEGIPTRAAAQTVGLREAAFKSRLHRGRTQLRALLEPYMLLSEV